MYYRTSGRRGFINKNIDRWLKEGRISPEMGRGVFASQTGMSPESGYSGMNGNFGRAAAGGMSGNSGGMNGNSGGMSGNSGGMSGNSGGMNGNSGGMNGNSGGMNGNSGGMNGNSGGMGERADYDEFSRIWGTPESPIPDGEGGYVPNGGSSFPPSEERSRLNAILYDGIYDREIMLMHNLYGRINRLLYPFVVKELDNMEYPGSPIFDYDLPERAANNTSGSIRDDEPDREIIGRIVNNIYDDAAKSIDDINEIVLDDNSETAGESREELIKAIIESLVLTELFLSRRPFYRETSSAYRYYNGRYDGLNPTV